MRIALTMALVRHLFEHRQTGQANTWRYMGATPIMRLSNLIFGIVGLGRIGKASARKAAGLGMTVIAYDPYIPAGGFRFGRGDLGRFRHADVDLRHRFAARAAECGNARHDRCAGAVADETNRVPGQHRARPGDRYSGVGGGGAGRAARRRRYRRVAGRAVPGRRSGAARAAHRRHAAPGRIVGRSGAGCAYPRRRGGIAGADRQSAEISGQQSGREIRAMARRISKHRTSKRFREPQVSTSERGVG